MKVRITSISTVPDMSCLISSINNVGFGKITLKFKFIYICKIWMRINSPGRCPFNPKL